jgi:hypothetical protein
VTDGLFSAVSVTDELSMTIWALLQIAFDFEMIIDRIFFGDDLERADIAFLNIELSCDKICNRNIAFLPSLSI